MKPEKEPQHVPHSESAAPEDKDRYPDDEAVTRFLKEEYTGLSYRDFEANLRASGLLSRLEQAGLLPTEEAGLREKVLRDLYLGSVLAQLDPNLLTSPVLIFSGSDVEP